MDLPEELVGDGHEDESSGLALSLHSLPHGLAGGIEARGRDGAEVQSFPCLGITDSTDPALGVHAGP